MSSEGSPDENDTEELGVSARHQPRGIFDGFEGYRTPTEADYRSLFTKGLVVPDTNVLLNLYRYHERTRIDLFATLDRLGERLWVPHQVMEEFWRGRGSAFAEGPQTTARETVEELNNLQTRAVEALRKWARRVSLSDERVDELAATLDHGFDEVKTVVDDLITTQNDEPTLDTNRDPITRELERILNGRVGDPLKVTDYANVVEEGKRRIAAKVPPGYKDAHKDDVMAVGDYLVWEQVLREAQRRKSDVLFVTGDVKEDWWRKERGQWRGPRIELVNEMWQHAGARLFMLRTESFLVHAASMLQIDVREESFHDIENVEFITTQKVIDTLAKAALELRIRDPIAREYAIFIQGQGYNLDVDATIRGLFIIERDGKRWSARVCPRGIADIHKAVTVDSSGIRLLESGAIAICGWPLSRESYAYCRRIYNCQPVWIADDDSTWVGSPELVNAGLAARLPAFVDGHAS